MEEAKPEGPVEAGASPLTDVIGNALGQIGIALIAITRAMKNQPGFSRASFDEEVQTMLSRVKEDNPIVVSILKGILDNPPTPGEVPASEGAPESIGSLVE